MKIFYLLLAGLVLMNPLVSFSQSPGQIIRPLPAAVTALNPDGNGYSSKTTSGFVSSDISESEIPFKVVPPAVAEPTGDLATGPSGGFTDIVKTVDSSGFYVYSDGTNIFFRLRIGSISSGSKGYSALIDTDNKIGNTGPNADPNYVAPTNTSNGNPGFEYEVVLQTNFQVAVYAIDGTATPGTPTVFPLSSNSQISVALSTDGGNPDYFYDWYVPLSAIGNPSTFRLAATTIISPSSALQGTASDIYGINNTNTTVSDGWIEAVNAQPSISVTSIGTGGTGVGADCTAAPVLSGPISFGSSVSITGTWTRMDVSKPGTAKIRLYRNGTLTDSTTVATGVTWTITLASVANGDVFYAKAQATGESQCLQSNSVIAGCTSYPAPPVLSQSSSKGMCGTLPAGASIMIYQMASSGSNTLMNSGNANTTYPTTTSFNWYSCSGGASNVSNGSYMIMASVNGCLSTPVFDCISSGSSSLSGLASNALTLSTVYPYQTSVNGSGATSGSVLRLFVNNVQVSSITATGSSFTFSNLSLKAGDQLKVYAQSGTGCVTISSAFTVSCYNQPPVITTDANGKILNTATAISGTSLANASITLNRTSPTTASWTTTANSSGAWSVTGLTLTANEVYTATVTSTPGCSLASVASTTATVVAPTTTCPTITSSPVETSTSVSGSITTAATGTIRLYLDDALEGTVSIASTGTSSWTVSSLNYPLYSGGVLRASFQAGTNAESTGCATVTVNCTSPLVPVIQSVSPGTIINAGQSLSFSLGNITANTWYGLSDNTGFSYATGIYTTTATNLTLPTRSFNTAGDYNLKITADKLTGCPASFVTTSLRVNPVILPVHYLNVSVKENGNQFLISWTVTEETDVLRYEVEKSLDGRNFGFLAAANYQRGTAGNHTYSLQDPVIRGQNIFYRIREVDLNGRSQYSSIVRIRAGGEWSTMIAPNPAHERLTIGLNSLATENLHIDLLDMSGRTVYATQSLLQPGNNAFEIRNLSPLGRGQYILRLRSKTFTEYHKLVLQ
ncbi:MAG: T9SS type A sorting domain-containing protein [Flavisolibacter sp.]